MSLLKQLNEESMIRLKRLLISVTINLGGRVWFLDCTKPTAVMRRPGFWFPLISLSSKHSLPISWRMKTRSSMFYALRIYLMGLAAPCHSVFEGSRSRRLSLYLVRSVQNCQTNKCQSIPPTWNPDVWLFNLRTGIPIFTVRSDRAGYP